MEIGSQALAHFPRRGIPGAAATRRNDAPLCRQDPRPCKETISARPIVVNTIPHPGHAPPTSRWRHLCWTRWPCLVRTQRNPRSASPLQPGHTRRPRRRCRQCRLLAAAQLQPSHWARRSLEVRQVRPLPPIRDGVNEAGTEKRRRDGRFIGGQDHQLMWRARDLRWLDRRFRRRWLEARRYARRHQHRAASILTTRFVASRVQTLAAAGASATAAAPAAAAAATALARPPAPAAAAAPVLGRGCEAAVRGRYLCGSNAVKFWLRLLFPLRRHCQSNGCGQVKGALQKVDDAHWQSFGTL
mmetsp:Transcript_47514/g.132463  ORF Transcript_47514/g.132463 Transcript_47514/m.132463 type:complete len:300 (+) Transcript_47514:78-977(+)